MNLAMNENSRNRKSGYIHVNLAMNEHFRNRELGSIHVDLAMNEHSGNRKSGSIYVNLAMNDRLCMETGFHAPPAQLRSLESRDMPGILQFVQHMINTSHPHSLQARQNYITLSDPGS